MARDEAEARLITKPPSDHLTAPSGRLVPASFEPGMQGMTQRDDRQTLPKAMRNICEIADWGTGTQK
jgi:hypothetical protein